MEESFWTGLQFGLTSTLWAQEAVLSPLSGYWTSLRNPSLYRHCRKNGQYLFSTHFVVIAVIVLKLKKIGEMMKAQLSSAWKINVSGIIWVVKYGLVSCHQMTSTHTTTNSHTNTQVTFHWQKAVTFIQTATWHCSWFLWRTQGWGTLWRTQSPNHSYNKLHEHNKVPALLQVLQLSLAQKVYSWQTLWLMSI